MYINHIMIKCYPLNFMMNCIIEGPGHACCEQYNGTNFCHGCLIYIWIIVIFYTFVCRKIMWRLYLSSRRNLHQFFGITQWQIMHLNLKRRNVREFVNYFVVSANENKSVDDYWSNFHCACLFLYRTL